MRRGCPTEAPSISEEAGAVIVDRAKFEEAKMEYYKLVGWDEEGIPTPEELKRLGLEDVNRKLRETLET